MKTISVAISDSSDVLCFDQYPINIFAKSAKAKRCTGVIIKLTLHCLSVTVKDPNLQQRYRSEAINNLDTRYFVVLEPTLVAW